MVSACMTALPVPDQAATDPVGRIAALMAGFSIEATRPSDADIAALSVLKRGTRVSISAQCLTGRPKNRLPPPSASAQEALSQCRTWQCAISAVDALDDLLARLNGEAEVEAVPVIAGDRDERGPFRCALDAID